MDLRLHNIKRIDAPEQDAFWYYIWQTSTTIHVIMEKL